MKSLLLIYQSAPLKFNHITKRKKLPIIKSQLTNNKEGIFFSLSMHVSEQAVQELHAEYLQSSEI